MKNVQILGIGAGRAGPSVVRLQCGGYQVGVALQDVTAGEAQELQAQVAEEHRALVHEVLEGGGYDYQGREELRAILRRGGSTRG